MLEVVISENKLHKIDSMVLRSTNLHFATFDNIIGMFKIWGLQYIFWEVVGNPPTTAYSRHWLKVLFK